jgi:hypothetical protein
VFDLRLTALIRFPAVELGQDIERLNSWNVGASGQLPLSYRALMGASVSYDSEDFANLTRKRFSSSLYVTYEF